MAIPLRMVDGKPIVADAPVVEKVVVEERIAVKDEAIVEKEPLGPAPIEIQVWVPMFVEDILTVKDEKLGVCHEVSLKARLRDVELAEFAKSIRSGVILALIKAPEEAKNQNGEA